MFGYQIIVCVLLSSILVASGSHFRGAIFTWKPTGNGTEVSFRISWRRGTAMCTDKTVGSLIRGEGSMRCFSSNCRMSQSLAFYCTDFSVDDDWTTGRNSFSYDPGTRAVISFGFSGGFWIGGMNFGGGNWRLVVTADLSVRADTGKINSSPTVEVAPIVELQYGCSHEIALPVYDADGDTIRCRFATSTKNECAGICNSFPKSTIDKDSCILKYFANDRTGYYPVALQVEDFKSNTPTTPLSSIPVQFLVYVYKSAGGCGSRPEFVIPTPVNRDRFCLQIGTEFNLNVTVAASNSLSEIKTISPVGLIRTSPITWTNKTANFMSIKVSWTPTTSDAGEHTFCFTAKDSGRMSSEQRCVLLFIGQEGGEPSIDSVKKSNQSDNSTGIVMDIVYDKEISQQTDESFIYIYHANGTLLKKIDASSEDVTVSDRQLSVSVGITNEELEYYVLFDKGVVAGTDECSSPSDEITNQTEVVVKACPPAPQADINGYSNSTQDTSSLGGIAYYWCNTGYKLNGPHVLECLLTGEWSSEAPKCSQIDCGPPPAVDPHGYRIWNYKTIYGATANYSCVLGYLPLSTSSLTCDATGTWNGKLLSCQIADCGQPPTANPNSSLYFETTSYGSTANYTCDQGFGIVGSDTLYCNSSGKWNHSSPHCSQTVTCKSDRPIDIVVIADTSHNTDARTVEALPLFIDDMIQRFNNTTSTHVGLITFGSCIHLHSYLKGLIDKPANIQAKIKDISYKGKDRLTNKALAFVREHVLTECNGMRKEATKIAVVITNGQSNDQESTVRESGHLQYDGVTVFTINTAVNSGNESKRMASSPEYAFGNEYDGTFGVSNELFGMLCSVCASPVPQNGLSDMSTYSINSTVRITCQEGYVLQGDSVVFCDENGSWNGSATCEIIRCQDPTPYNAKTNAEDFTVNTTITVQCDEGFTLQGDARITCLPNGTWSDVVQCIKIEKRCKENCYGVVDGNYQSCTTCEGYVACSGGYLYNMPCPAGLKWDDDEKRCEYSSATCPQI